MSSQLSPQLDGVSLFAGVGGFDLAMHAAGIAPRVAVEIDDKARGVLADRFPDTSLFNDVCKVTPDDLYAAGLVPGRTVLCGGFPCQDLSVAGRRRGMGEGTRSGLFFEIVRILAGFPAEWVVLENVPGLLSAVCPCLGDESCNRDDCPGELHNIQGGVCPGGCIAAHGGAMGAVLGELGRLGYGYAYRVLDAQHFGVPQRRRRVFIVARRTRDAWATPVEVLLEPEGRVRDFASCDPKRQDVAERVVVGTLQAGGGERGYRVSAESAADGHLVLEAAGFALNQRDEPRSLPGTAFALQANPGSGEQMVTTSVFGDKTHALTAEGADASEDGTGRGTPVIAQTLTAGSRAPNVSAPGRRQEDDFNLVIADTLRSHPRPGSNSNGALAFHHMQSPISGDVSPTIGARSRGMGLQEESTVRRLTPMECERLQGFPDGWTTTSEGKAQADSSRYKQMGNAVAVPVVAWILGRLVAVDGGR